uniref:Secreted protein n=1 Tax=Parastrongyloides trichosuri TaxID=131310 RepID=A0A0N4ZDI0_PARTI
MVIWTYLNLILLALIFNVSQVHTCANSDDLTIISNPTLTITFQPPSAWTYPESTAEETLSFFPGQPMTQTIAQNIATNDMESAVIAAFKDVGIPSDGISVTTTYIPQLYHDCYKNSAASTDLQSLTVGSTFQIYENGVITRTATISGADLTYDICLAQSYSENSITLAYTDISLQATIKIDNFSSSKFTVKQIASIVTTKLVFGRGVKFLSEIVIS